MSDQEEFGVWVKPGYLVTVLIKRGDEIIKAVYIAAQSLRVAVTLMIERIHSIALLGEIVGDIDIAIAVFCKAVHQNDHRLWGAGGLPILGVDSAAGLAA